MNDNRPLARGCQQAFPETGKFAIDAWADIFECSVRTIKNDIEQHNIPTLHCGGSTIIVAELWWAVMMSGVVKQTDESTKPVECRPRVTPKKRKPQS